MPPHLDPAQLQGGLARCFSPGNREDRVTRNNPLPQWRYLIAESTGPPQVLPARRDRSRSPDVAPPMGYEVGRAKDRD